MNRTRPAADADEANLFILGGNGNTLAFVNSFRTDGDSITARLVPIAWTPIGVVIGDNWQNVGISAGGLLDWVDRTFAPEDERSFVAPLRDMELLARVQWHAELPESLADAVILNGEDVPDDVAEGLAHPLGEIVQCAACRRLCVRDDFVWREKQLCAWDFHAQVFGKRGPWRDGAYEEHHFETLPQCAYVSPPLLSELGVELIMQTNAIDTAVAEQAVNIVLASDPQRAHLAVRTEGGFTVLRENAAAAT